MNATPASSTTSRRRRRRWPWFLAAAVLALLVLVLVFDANWLKGPIERRVHAATGRELRIEGDLELDLFWPPAIAANDLHFADADWAGDGDMASAERLRIAVSPWSLLGGALVLPSVEADRPRVHLARNAEGVANWRFDTGREPDTDDGPPPRIGQLLVRDGRLTFVDERFRTDLHVDVDSERPRGGERARLVARGDGRFRGGEFSLQAQVDSPIDLQDAARPWRFEAQAQAGATRAEAAGELRGPLRLDRFEIDATLSGDSLADLREVAEIVLPQTPPFSLKGTLSREGDVWRYRDFSGTVGDSDLAGSGTFDLSGEQPLLTTQLRSRRLDFDDLGGLVGTAPATGEGETASPEQRELAAERARSGRALPTREYDLQALRAMDADARLVAESVDGGPLPLQTLDATITLDDGRLRLDPLTLGVAEGEAEGTIELDAREDPIAASADLRLRRLSLPALFDSELTRDSQGRIGGRVNLSGHGNSIAAMLGNADGEVALLMGRGRISNLLLELAGLDVFEALRFLIGDDRVIPVSCAYVAFAVENGVMRTESFAFDTPDTVLLGEGSIDLGAETLDLRIEPRPKDPSPLAARVPLEVDGSFRDPSIAPAGGPLLLRGLAAAALYAVAPPAALLALIETGPGEGEGCRRTARDGDDSGQAAASGEAADAAEEDG